MPEIIERENEIVECRDMTGNIECREDPEKKKRYFQGYAARFNIIADLYFFDEEVMPGAFAESILSDDIRALQNHNPDIVLGRNRAKTLELKEDNAGLYSIIDPPATQSASDIIESVKRGDVSQMSFQFIVREEKWIFSDERKEKHDLRQIIKAQLRDVSIVTFPAYDVTNVAYRTAEARSIESIYKNRSVRPVKRAYSLNNYFNKYCECQ